jgi:glucan phosphoethanolaminetransferase (alkaline phosphatase superfamily)
MIQRVQSVFLFLLVVAMVALFFVPIWAKTNPADGQEYALTAFRLGPVTGDGASSNTIVIAILAGAAALIALYEIFQYKNRLTQMKLGMLNSLVMAALMGCAFYFSSYVGEDLVKTKEQGEYLSGFYLPAVGLLMNVLANRFIKRDEDLVRSMDRLR